jgi:hypothetical protein
MDKITAKLGTGTAIHKFFLENAKCFKYCLINEQECFIRFKDKSAQREWL